MQDSDAYNALYDLIKKHGDIKLLPDLDADLFRAMAIDGDDVNEFLEDFCKCFDVDISNYLWYFHQREEPCSNFGAMFFKPPNDRVQPIPVTITILRDAIRTKSWPVEYPSHTLPKRRWDIVIGQILLGTPPLTLSIIVLMRGLKWLAKLF